MLTTLLLAPPDFQTLRYPWFVLRLQMSNSKQPVFLSAN